MYINLRLSLPAFALALFTCHAASAQAPAGAPAGANGLCKDGTYSTAPVKSGACGGHKGVQTWFGPAATPKPAPAATLPPVARTTAAPVPMAAPAPAPAAKPAAAPAATKTSLANTPVAGGGGPGMVWVNTASKVYHCPTDRYYGKTKAGKYLTESAAQAEGDKPDAGKKCN